MTAAACPRCGSTDPAAALGPCVGIDRFTGPPHPWHDRPTGADQIDGDGGGVGRSATPSPSTGADDLAGEMQALTMAQELLETACDLIHGPEPAEDDCAYLDSADALEGVAARIRELEAGLAAAVRELDAAHRPSIGRTCMVCGTADGSWPCTSRMVADDLRKLL